ncbi:MULTISPECIES: hypothetical protein [unclassified Nostoc]|uniref:hypothetical protein n=1 Tax=unclassified Nostoc TaxID=2593658 RepID=UPI00262437C3|nr:hypothetical protein [Nostoc sp. S13]MDF5735737.1 hypothetical protein [Nostoc sp. S13]
MPTAASYAMVGVDYEERRLIEIIDTYELSLFINIYFFFNLFDNYCASVFRSNAECVSLKQRNQENSDLIGLALVTSCLNSSYSNRQGD